MSLSPSNRRDLLVAAPPADAQPTGRVALSFRSQSVLEYLTKEFPNFITQIRQYRGRPLSEMLAVFKAEAKSKEELLIEMRGAVSAEDYQRAAAIRDQLKALEADEHTGRSKRGRARMSPTCP